MTLKNKELRNIIIAIAITFAITLVISVLIFCKVKYSNIREVKEDVKEAKLDVEKQGEDAEAYYKKGIDYKKQNDTLRKDIKSLNDTDRDCYLKFMKHSLFLNDYAEYNNKFYLSNVDFYNSLLIYESELNDYNKAIQHNLHRIILTPMLVTDFKKIGFELNLSIPITTDLLLTGGIGYFDKVYFKIGAGFRL